MTWDFIYRDEKRDLDDTTRLAVDGDFIRLSPGWTHYERAGAGTGHAVVLVHGFSVPYFIWDPTFRALSEAGLPVVRYDLYGRGYSDRPRVAYDLGLFVRQLLELIDALELPQVDLVGLSMGGPIVSAFKVAHATRVRRIVLIDPVGAQAMPLSFLYRLAALPGISEAALAIFGTRYMVRGVASDFFDKELVELFQERYKTQMEFKGFKRAIISSLRHHMLGSFREIYARLGNLPSQTLIIWGQNDRTVPFAQSAELVELLPGAVIYAVPDCGHVPHYEKPETVNPRLVDFLRAA